MEKPNNIQIMLKQHSKLLWFLHEPCTIFKMNTESQLKQKKIEMVYQGALNSFQMVFYWVNETLSLFFNAHGEINFLSIDNKNNL